MIEITIKLKVENPGVAHQLITKLQLQNPGIEITEATGPDPETGKARTYKFKKESKNEKVDKFLKPHFGKEVKQTEAEQPPKPDKRK